MAGVSFTLEASPTYPPGAIIGAYDRLFFPGPPPFHDPPIRPADAFATNDPDTGHAVFTELKPNRHYYFGAETDGRWRWISGETDRLNEAGERARAEAREAELIAELQGIPGKEGGIGPAVREAGRVELWGEATGSDLAQGVDPQSNAFLSPVEGIVLSEITKVAGGGQHFTSFLDKTGKVWCTGGSTFGQQGDRAAIDRPTPHLVSMPNNELVIDLSAHSNPAALLASGRVAVWGGNVGQLSIGYDPIRQTARFRATYARAAPGVILNDVRSIYAGHNALFVVMNNGTVRRAGIQDNQEAFRYATEIPGVSNVKQVVGSKEFMCVRLADGSLRIKGVNQHGQRGIGTLGEIKTGPATTDITEWQEPHVGPKWGTPAVVDMDASENDMIVLLADATVRTWGRNHHAQCGLGYQDQNTELPTVTPVGGGAITASIAGTTMTVTAGNSAVQVGAILAGAGVALETEVTAKLTSNTWTVGITQTMSSRAIECGALWRIDWPLRAHQVTYEPFWRATGLASNITATIEEAGGGSITASISATTLTVNSGAANVKVGCELRGGGVLAGTEVLAELTSTTFTLSKSQSVFAATFTVTACPTLVVSTGYLQVAAGCIVKGGAVKSGTKVTRLLGGTRFEVNKAQVVGSTSMEVLPDSFTQSQSGPELAAGVTTFTATGWAQRMMEAKVVGNAPVVVPTDPGVTNVKQVISYGGEESGGPVGDYGCLLIKEDTPGVREIWGWGGASEGELGNGDTIKHMTPVRCCPEISDAISMGSTESHSGVIRPGLPTAVPRMTAVAVPATKDILVSWTPEPGERTTGWILKWQRAENNPVGGAPEGFKHDTQGGVSSLTLPASATSHVIKGVADGDNPGLPLPELWANATNMLEIQLASKYTTAKPAVVCTHIGPGKWLIEWTETEGPSALVYKPDGSTETKKSAEPGWIVHYRLRSTEAFSANPVEEVKALGVGEKNSVVVEGIPEGVSLEAEVKGSFGGTVPGNGKWNVRQVEAIAENLGDEVPWLKVPCMIKGSIPHATPAAEPDSDREIRANVVVQYIESTSLSGSAGSWGVTWTDKPNAKGEKEPGWVVQWKLLDKGGWLDPEAEPGESAVRPPGAGSYTITTTKRPEVRIIGTRSGVGDVVRREPGLWGGKVPQSGTVQWYRQYHSEGRSVAIGGATSIDYQVQPHDIGHALRCEELTENSVGKTNVNVGKLGTRFLGEPSMPIIGD